MVKHLDAFPLFQRIGDEELAKDPVVEQVKTSYPYFKTEINLGAHIPIGPKLHRRREESREKQRQ